MPPGPISPAKHRSALGRSTGVHDLLPAAGASTAALTVDDGPDPHWTPQVLALLARYRVQATSSLIGRQAHAHPDLARRVLAEGHAICNHTKTHPLTFARGPADPGRQPDGPHRLERRPAGLVTPRHGAHRAADARHPARGHRALPRRRREPGGDVQALGTVLPFLLDRSLTFITL